MAETNTMQGVKQQEMGERESVDKGSALKTVFPANFTTTGDWDSDPRGHENPF